MNFFTFARTKSQKGDGHHGTDLIQESVCLFDAISCPPRSRLREVSSLHDICTCQTNVKEESKIIQDIMEGLQNQIPDEIVLNILSYVGARDLLAFQGACRHYRNLPTEQVWKALFRRRCTSYSIYAQNTSIEKVALTWKGRYQWLERDIARTELTMSDLQELKWQFSYVPWAGESSASSEAYFYQNRLFLLKYLWIYPNLDCSLVDIPEDRGDGSDFVQDENQHVFDEGLESAVQEPLEQALILADMTGPRYSVLQYLRISRFPPHYVARASNGGWIVWNHNVVLFTNGDRKEADLPDQLQMHMSMFRF